MINLKLYCKALFPRDKHFTERWNNILENLTQSDFLAETLQTYQKGGRIDCG